MPETPIQEIKIHKPVANPYTPMEFMIEDYVDSRDGVLLTDNTYNGDPEARRQSHEQLSELRKSIASFAIMNGVPLELPASRLGLDAETLHKDIERDEQLLRITDRYLGEAQEEQLGPVEEIRRRVNLPALRGQEVERAFNRLGFELERINGSHAIVRRELEDGTTQTIVLPTRHPGDVNTRLLREIITNQAGLSVEEFIDAL